MASGKFFGWNKGERNVGVPDSMNLGGVLHMPLKCITVTDVDHDTNQKGSEKTRRRPLPLTFHALHGNQTTPTHITGESGLLCDAAISSATSLIAAMSDMLQFPQVSAHLAARKDVTGLQTLQVPVRPRSHTAPPTSCLDLSYTGPAELPGSTPDWPTAQLDTEPEHHADPRLTTSSMLSSSSDDTSHRPLSRAQDAFFAVPPLRRQSYDLFRRRMSNHCPNGQFAASHSINDPYWHTLTPTHTLEPIPSSRPDSTIEMSDQSLQVPPLALRKGSNTKEDVIPGSVMCTPTPTNKHGNIKHSPLPQAHETADGEALLMSQLVSMQIKHREHLQVLREAHEHELSLHQSYIAILEAQRGAHSNLNLQTTRNAAPDSSQHVDQATGPGTFAITSQSSVALPQQPTLAPPEYVEVDSVNRHLTSHAKDHHELGELQRQCKQLKDNAELDDQRIMQLKEIVRKAKDNDQAMKNAVANLQCRLEAANAERADALEELHEACEQNKALLKREAEWAKERDGLETRLFHADPKWSESLHKSGSRDCVVCGRKANSTESQAAIPNEKSTAEMEELRHKVLLKDSRIRELEKAVESKEPPPTPDLNGFEEVVALRAQLKEAEEARDSYSLLLHTELRKQIRQAMQKQFKITPHGVSHVSSHATTIVSASPTAQTEENPSASDKPTDEEPAEVRLEKELQHCLQEIIMYKLDIRGYKKDLKKAKQQIDNLQTIAGTDTLPLQHHASSAGNKHKRTAVHIPVRRETSGLGISFPLPKSAPIILTPMYPPPTTPRDQEESHTKPIESTPLTLAQTTSLLQTSTFSSSSLASHNDQSHPTNLKPHSNTENHHKSKRLSKGIHTSLATPHSKPKILLSPPASHNIQTQLVSSVNQHRLPAAPPSISPRKIPLSTHKELPKPPPSPSPNPFPSQNPTSPLPQTQTQTQTLPSSRPPPAPLTREPTLRSISDSIISCYAHHSPSLTQIPVPSNPSLPSLPNTSLPDTQSPSAVPRIQSFASSSGIGSPLSLHVSDAIAVPIAKVSVLAGERGGRTPLVVAAVRV